MFIRKTPKDLGVTSGKLKNCPDSPNCICSQYNTHDHHSIRPIKNIGDLSETLSIIHQVILKFPKFNVIQYKNNYLRVECKSKLFNFIDDLEFYADFEEDVIHVRSASRLGIWDFGVNRKRVEMIRKNLLFKSK